MLLRAPADEGHGEEGEHDQREDEHDDEVFEVGGEQREGCEERQEVEIGAWGRVDQSRVGRRDQPAAIADLSLELARTPSGVAGVAVEPTPVEVAQPGQRLPGGADVDPVEEPLAVGVLVLVAVDYQALFGLDGSPGTHVLLRVAGVWDFVIPAELASFRSIKEETDRTLVFPNSFNGFASSCEY